MNDSCFFLLLVGSMLAIILVLAVAPGRGESPELPVEVYESGASAVGVPERLGDVHQAARMAYAREVLAAHTTYQSTGYADLDRAAAEHETRRRIGYVWLPEDVRTRLDAGIEAGRRREDYYGERMIGQQPRPAPRRNIIEAILGR